MNSYLISDKPIIYADMNIYRYLAYKDISIVKPERFHWAYSMVHLNEIHRNGNTDALEGMRFLKAREVHETLNEHFQSVGDIRLCDYIDPQIRYENHLDTISGSNAFPDYIIEPIIRSFGADNFKELSKTPSQLREEVEKLTNILDQEKRQNLIEKASIVSNKIQSSIEEHYKKRMPIDTTRSTFGITSEDRKRIEKSNSAIDDVWNLISPAIPNVSKNQFFGFEPIPGVEGIQYTQHGSMSGAHLILNMIGISPDKGLAKREKIKNIMSDGQHIGMASYCNALISADKGIINKAKCIYSYLNNITNALHFEYQKGAVLNLNIS